MKYLTEPLHIRRNRKRIAAQHRSWLHAMAWDSLAGATIGAFIALAMIYFNIANLGSLVAASDRGFAFAALLAAGFAQLFAMAVCATGIWFRATHQPDLTDYPTDE
ncbi:hypothetical protein [Ahrensia sp. R2A130]|uniref:hypothetical protein n=1 Tax=Ahrensia sp. R2A130 TaxID=744979 RepID=UPI0001E08C83|nr:hypothetical protein [Ahrensia sp. R2A130]EFL89112.1 sensor histidine kinase [Ahrensia sp. R2A130]